MAWEYSSSSSNFDFLSTTIHEEDQEDDTKEQIACHQPSTNSGLDADHQEREVSSTVINNCTCGTDHGPEKNSDK